MSERFNVLLSFPRSGNTWVRYIAEFLSKRPTSNAPVQRCAEGFMTKQGVLSLDLKLGVDISKKNILTKRHRFDHNWDNWTKKNCRLILLIRNYKEAILRHAFASNKNQNTKEINKCIVGYNHCLDSYDKFDGDKICIYYEDLILHPKREIEKFVSFLKIPKGKVFDDFFKHYEYHKIKSLQSYKPGAMTRGRADKLSWHSTHAPNGVLKKITEDIKSNKRLYSKYLRRYN